MQGKRAKALIDRDACSCCDKGWQRTSFRWPGREIDHRKRCAHHCEQREKGIEDVSDDNKEENGDELAVFRASPTIASKLDPAS